MSTSNVADPSCIVCYSHYSNSILLPRQKTENRKLFFVFCKHLNVKLAPGVQWNFKKELLPLCKACSEIAVNILRLQQQIEEIEKQIGAEVEDIRQRVQYSESQLKPNKQSDVTEGIKTRLSEVSGRRVESFRRQVLNYYRFTATLSTYNCDYTGRHNPIIRRFKECNLNPIVVLRETDVVDHNVIEKNIKRRVNYFETSDIGEDPLDPQRNSWSEAGVNSPNSDLNPFQQIKFEHIKQEDEEPLPFVSDDEQDEDFQPPSVGGTEFTSPESDISGDEDWMLRHSVKKRRRQPCKRQDEGKEIIKKPFKKRKLPDSATSEFCEEKTKARRKRKLEGNGEDQSDETRRKRGPKPGTMPWNSKLMPIVRTDDGRTLYQNIEIIAIENGFECGLCQFTNTSKDAMWKLKTHVRSAHGDAFKCDICNKNYSTNFTLKKHIKEVHAKPKLSCDICGKPLKHAVSLRYHLWTHKSASEKASDEAEGKVPPASYKDVITKKVASHMCKTCGKLFVYKCKLIQHEATHLDKEKRRTNVCDLCGKFYPTMDSLKSHQRYFHHKDQIINPYECKLCGKKCFVKGSYNKHMRVHNKEKFTCPVCGESFISSAKLKTHSAKHEHDDNTNETDVATPSLIPTNNEVCDLAFPKEQSSTPQFGMENHSSERYSDVHVNESVAFNISERSFIQHTNDRAFIHNSNERLLHNGMYGWPM